MAEKNRRGRLVVISGFSGVGKGTIVNRLLKEYDHYAVSVSMTTRKPRAGEKEGVNYFFVSNKEFENMIENDGFLEYAGYVDHYYGTPRAFVEECLDRGIDVILEIEVQGAMQVKKKEPDAVLIFVTTASASEMAKRLIGRKTESREQITDRFLRAIEEAEDMWRYDFIVVNDNLEQCVRELDQIIVRGEGGRMYSHSFKERFVNDLREIVKKRRAEEEQ